jgi:hypothetical protein
VTERVGQVVLVAVGGEDRLLAVWALLRTKPALCWIKASGGKPWPSTKASGIMRSTRAARSWLARTARAIAATCEEDSLSRRNSAAESCAERRPGERH